MMRNTARQPWGAIAHSPDMPTLASSASTQHTLLLPTVVVGGPRYGALVAALYWGMLTLLVAVYGCTWVGYALPAQSDAQETLRRLHVIFGLGIFALFSLRLFIRLVDREPPMQPPLADWQARVAKALQWALFGFMVAMPVLGWTLLNAMGKPVALYGWELPVLVSTDKELTGTLKDLHVPGAMLGYLLMGLNIVAALYQQHIPNDRLPPPRALPKMR